MNRLPTISPGLMIRFLHEIGFKKSGNMAAIFFSDTPAAELRPCPFIKVRIWGAD
jgi:hypothetical protein